jgi:hypothetical protein
MRPRAIPPATSALYTLISAVPPERLRELVLTLMLDGAAPAEAAPAPRRGAAKRRKPGWPKGRKRGPRAPIAPAIPSAADRAKALALASVDERLAARRERTNAAKRAKRAAARGNGAASAASAALP